VRDAERLAAAVARVGLTQALKLDACLTSGRFPLHRCRPFADAIATLLRESGDRPRRPADSAAGCSADCRRGHDVRDHPGDAPPGFFFGFGTTALDTPRI
jgi:hypothetical protein